MQNRKKIEVGNAGFIEFIDKLGSDLTVVNAARVSFDKEKEVFEAGDTKLIRYLANNNHWTPFGHCQVQLRIKMPIFVARQWFKHTVGFTRNEMSRRYVNSEPDFFYPEDGLRLAAENVKQGSSKAISPDSRHYLEKMKNFTAESNQLYLEMINRGICAEQARMILPQNMYTSFIETASLFGYARLYNLRMGSHAQKEITDYAEAIGQIMQPLFPESWKALSKVDLNLPEANHVISPATS